jgi:hypothetical protein
VVYLFVFLERQDIILVLHEDNRLPTDFAEKSSGFRRIGCFFFGMVCDLSSRAAVDEIEDIAYSLVDNMIEDFVHPSCLRKELASPSCAARHFEIEACVYGFCC